MSEKSHYPKERPARLEIIGSYPEVSAKILRRPTQALFPSRNIGCNSPCTLMRLLPYYKERWNKSEVLIILLTASSKDGEIQEPHRSPSFRMSWVDGVATGETTGIFVFLSDLLSTHPHDQLINAMSDPEQTFGDWKSENARTSSAVKGNRTGDALSVLPRAGT